jgi:hypothetical protein
MTAQLAVGTPHPHHDGIIPTHVAWLSENGRAGWLLEPTARGLWGTDESWTQEEISWVPGGPEHILEDGLLLIAVHVLRDESLLELARKNLPELLDDSAVELEKMPVEILVELRERCQHVDMGQKAVVTVLGGSSLEGQLPLLERYPMQVEVCTVTYSRTANQWNPARGIRGSLTASWSSAGPRPNRYGAIYFPSAVPGALAESNDESPDLPSGPEVISEEDQPTDQDRGSLDASRKGKAAELLVAASCILASRGELNVSTSLVDDEGVDLVVHRRGRPATLALQVKSRFTSAATTRAGRFTNEVRGQTFAPREDFYILFLIVDARRAERDLSWLVPSRILAERIRSDSPNRLRFSASMSDGTQDQWRDFRIAWEELPARLLSILSELDATG